MKRRAFAATVMALLLLNTLPSAAEEPFQVVDLCNSKRCTEAEVAAKLQLVASVKERFSPNRDGHIKIDIKFTRSVSKDSVVVGKTVILDAPLDHAAQATLLWFAEEADSFTLISEKSRADLFPPGRANIDFTLTLRGVDSNGSGVVKSLDGQILDGDGNGAPGGDYRVHYTCRNVDPFWCQAP